MPGELPVCQRGPRAGLPRQPKRDRTKHLYPEDLLRIANAHDFAESIALEWGTAITLMRIHWHGPGASDLPAMQDRALKLLRTYAQKHGLPFEFLWTRECSLRRKDHLHLVTTIPEGHCEAVQDLLSRRMHFSTGGVKVKPADNPFTYMRYLCKQLDPNLVHVDGDYYRLRDFVGLRKEKGDEPMPYRRAGASKGVGPARQAKAGFKAKRTVDDLRDFFAGNRDNPKPAKRRGWDDGPPDIAEPYETRWG